MVVRFKIVFAVALGALVVAGSSFAAGAQKPPAYQGNAGNVQEQVKGAAGTLGSLPFTGAWRTAALSETTRPSAGSVKHESA